MKRHIFIICVLCALACALTGCKPVKKPVYDEYAGLNTKLGASYSQISITVNNTFTDEDITLESKYTVKYSQSEITVDYKVERFASVSLENPTDEVKTVYEGTAVIVGGIISGGSEVGLTADISKLSLNFKEEYFNNAVLTGIFFKADVKNASAFLGADVSCTDMTVSAEYVEVFSVIEINYTESGNKIQYLYEFTI